jgi:Cysteine-rich secretory protein family
MTLKLCTNQHDQCRNTESLRYVGQNIYVFGSTEDNVTIEEVIGKAVDAWNNEVRLVKDFSMQCSTSDPAAGHLYQLIFENVRGIGCAIRKEPDRTYWKYVVYCNYDYGVITDKPLYKVSNVPGSDCKLGRDPQFPNLCKNDEPMPEDWMHLFPKDGSFGNPAERFNYC